VLVSEGKDDLTAKQGLQKGTEQLITQLAAFALDMDIFRRPLVLREGTPVSYFL
jgi:hypothetical protein